MNFKNCVVEVYHMLPSYEGWYYAYRIKSRNGRIIGGSTDPQKRKAHVMKVANAFANKLGCKVKDLTT